jgi:hypothetical protein
MKQKDAGVKEFVSANITYLLKTYTDLNDDQIREIVWKIMLAANDLATEARQQAFTEALEAAPGKEELTGDTMNPEEILRGGFNQGVDEYRANIEKLKKHE